MQQEHGETLRGGRRHAWLDGRELDDVALAAYLAELHDAGRASSSASMAVAAACFRAKLAGQPTSAGARTARVPEWTADVRGVYWILAQRRETCTEMANSG